MCGGKCATGQGVDSWLASSKRVHGGGAERGVGQPTDLASLKSNTTSAVLVNRIIATRRASSALLIKSANPSTTTADTGGNRAERVLIYGQTNQAAAKTEQTR